MESPLARKPAKPRKARNITPKPAPASDAKALEILDPDIALEVADPDTGKPVQITVREFRFREGLEIRALAGPLIADLAAQVGDEAAPSGGVVEAALAAHGDLWLALAARACGREVDWLARLRDADAARVSGALWQANMGFFVRHIVAEAGPGWMARLSASQTSSQPLPPRGTETSDPSRTH